MMETLHTFLLQGGNMMQNVKDIVHTPQYITISSGKNRDDYRQKTSTDIRPEEILSMLF